jgi:DNA polymerase-3 subunit delta'
MMTKWESVIGHDWAVEMLAGGLRHGRTGHAYLITGPGQIGKTTLARAFAQALNCEDGDVGRRPCGQCRACQLIAADRHPDVRLVSGEVSGRGKLTLKIEQIRALQQDLNLAPYEGRWKVAILRQFDAANPSAANAFLKTLEEPPRQVILLLTASESDALLPTISSRCRTIGLRPLPAPVIIDALQSRWRAAPEQARLLAALADGRLGWAVQALQNPDLLKTRQEHLDALREAVDGGRVARFELADKLARKPENLPPILLTWVSWWRDLLLLAWGNVHPERLSNIDQSHTLQQLAQRWPPDHILHSLKQTEKTIGYLEQNANTRLAVENLLLQYPLSQPQAG